MGKCVSFARNAVIGATVGFAAGAGAAELSDLLLDSNTAVGCIATATNLLVAYGVFLPLHYRSNREVYQNEDGPDYRQFARDQAKLVGALGAMDVLYLVIDPVIISQFLEAGTQPLLAKSYSDIILGLTAMAVTLPIAKLTGNVR